MNLPKVSVIVPVHNRIEYTLRFLESVYKLNYSNFEIILIDDGSTDGTFETVSRKYPEVNILSGDGNFWWTKSINTGVKYAIEKGTDFILTLNNDTEVDSDLLNILVECSNKNPDSIIGSKVVDIKDHNKIFFGGGKMDWIFPPHFIILPLGNNDNEAYSQIREVDFLAGMGCLVPVEVFNKIGLYNEDYLPQYFADGEFTLRAKRNSFKLLFNPEAIVYNNVESISWSFPDKINLESLKKILFHKGSPYYLKATKYVYFTYWSILPGLLAFSLLYLKCFAGILLSLVPGGKKVLKWFRT